VTQIYVINGHDISLYASPEAVCSEVEGYDAPQLEYLVVDGSVWKATVDGPKCGAVRLHRSGERRPDLIARLRAAGSPVNDCGTPGN
jgi:hypothetical protein